jgi:hypothetical protein
MGLVSAIVALCKAVPILERLFLGVADAVREAKAKARYEAKLDHIDAAMRLAGRLPGGAGTEWSEDVDRSPTVPEGDTLRASVDKGGTSQGG